MAGVETDAEIKQIAMVAPLQLQAVAKPSKPIANSFLPDEVIKALKPAQPTIKSKPVRKDELHSSSCPVSSRPPASMWFYPRQRQKFQHLLTDTICSCGAGKDISFLYDSASFKQPTRMDGLSTDIAIKDKSDPSVIRKEAADKRRRDRLPAVVSSEEMQMVQNMGVVSLNIRQQGPAGVVVGEHTRHPALLPAMGPTSREQAKHLRSTLDSLLSNLGYGKEDEQPTQMHHLLELIKQEQDVYNTVFHELIRQVTVDCFERGELLSALREKYNNLINRIPKQVLSLHHELVAQRALDRRLVDELSRFQCTITILTKDLERAQSHDKLVSEQAKRMEKELFSALRHSERTDELISQFRQLYELQRLRLESRVASLIEERDNWVNMSYLMSAKVIDANGLAAARKALQTERSWSTMAVHFAAILSDKDADCLLKISNYVQKVQTECNLLSAMAASESETVRNKLQALRASMLRISSRPIVAAALASGNSDKKSAREVLPQNSPIDVDLFMDRARRWLLIVSELSELMSGDALLRKRQRVDACKKNFAECREVALTVYRFHKSAEGSDLPSRAYMSKVTRELPVWLEELFIRVSGDAGLGAALARYAREMDLWVATSQAQGIDIARIPGVLQTWIRKTIECIELYEASMKVKGLNLTDVILDFDSWLTGMNSEVGGDNAVITDRAHELHQTWLQWLAQSLARLVPDNETMAEDQLARSAKFILPLDIFSYAAINLGRSIDAYTELMLYCLRDRVVEGSEDANSLVQLKTDCHVWLEAMWELIGQIMPPEQPQPTCRWAAALLPLSRIRAAINSRAWEEIPESDQLYYADAENEMTEEELNKAEIESDDEAAILLASGGPSQQLSRYTTQAEEAGEASAEAPAAGSSIPASEKTEVKKEEGDSEVPEQAQTLSEQQVTWANKDGALHEYKPDEAPESRQHLSTLTTGLAEFLPDTQRAASAIPIVEALQDQLQISEDRCRDLEARARKAEHALGELADKMRLLQQGPPLPEGQEWRLAEDAEFANLFEKMQSNEVTIPIPKAGGSTGPASPHSSHSKADSRAPTTSRKSPATPSTRQAAATRKKK